MLITSEAGIRLQDFSAVTSSVYSNHYGLNFTINFIRQNFMEIIGFNGGVDLLATILTGIAEHVSTRDQAEELRNFIEENQANLGTAVGASQQALRTVEENLAWLDQNGEEISNWLSVSLPSTTPAPPLTTPHDGAGSFSASVFAITVSLILTCVRFV
uniref:ERAP1-like C-terminal domain-containing protein n=1 Tax=Timema bartmani TaxID=61472 RepID=A0A7R9F2T2_9NEOP|nr:unnamed protein product [Timema bartmani]